MGHKRILVVDDSELIADMLAAHLEKAGYNVVKAGDGDTAMQCIKAERPDLIILDHHLPDILGVDLCKLIKERHETKLTPIIICTAEAKSTMEKVNGLDAGADDYVLKPFEPLELMSRVHALLRRCEEFEQNTKELLQAEKIAGTNGDSKPAISQNLPIPDKTEEIPRVPALFYQLLFTPIQTFNLNLAISQISSFKLVIFVWSGYGFFYALSGWQRGGFKLFMSQYLSASHFLLPIVILVSALLWVLLKLLKQEKVSYAHALNLSALALFPFIIKGLLVAIYVYCAGYPAEPFQFSAGLELFLTGDSSKMMRALARGVDLFPVWSALLLTFGLRSGFKFSMKKSLIIAHLSIILVMLASIWLP